MIKGQEAKLDGKTFYQAWVEDQGIPVSRDFFIEDIRTLKLAPWKRKGGYGILLNLEGTDELNDAYVCEIPPGKSLNPQRHLFEEMIYVISGRGGTSVWNDGGRKHTFEWQAGSLFSPPLNAMHQHFNGSGTDPARYIAVTSAPLVMNLFHNSDFVFQNSFSFSDRFPDEEGYFSGEGKAYGRIWDTNFVPDVNTFQLQDWSERGGGSRNVRFELSENTMTSHISEFGVGTYKKAHRHGPGAHVIILSGQGFSLMWPEGSPMRRFDWHEGSLVVPPGMWFHQHFNTGKMPARYLALRWGSEKHRFMWSTQGEGVDQDVKSGGHQIEYEDEDPSVHRMFEEELAREGVESRMKRH